MANINFNNLRIGEKMYMFYPLKLEDELGYFDLEGAKEKLENKVKQKAYILKDISRKYVISDGFEEGEYTVYWFAEPKTVKVEEDKEENFIPVLFNDSEPNVGSIYFDSNASLVLNKKDKDVKIVSPDGYKMKVKITEFPTENRLSYDINRNVKK